MLAIVDIAMKEECTETHSNQNVGRGKHYLTDPAVM